MRCPYCAEDIKDEAIFCRYCEHDLLFCSLTGRPLKEELALLMDRTTSSEKRLPSSPDAKESGSHIGTGATAPDTHIHEHYPVVHKWPMHAILLGFLSAVVATWTYQIALDAYKGSFFFIFWSFLLLSQLCPFPFGLLSGMVWVGRHLRAYMLIGLSAALVSLLAHMVVKGAEELAPKELVPGWDWLLLPALCLFSTTSLFLAGGLIGDKLEDRRNRNAQKGVFAEDLQNLREVVKRDKDRPERIELIKALGPACITSIAGITSTGGSLVIGAALSAGV